MTPCAHTPTLPGVPVRRIGGLADSESSAGLEHLHEILPGPCSPSGSAPPNMSPHYSPVQSSFVPLSYTLVCFLVLTDIL